VEGRLFEGDIRIERWISVERVSASKGEKIIKIHNAKRKERRESGVISIAENTQLAG